MRRVSGLTFARTGFIDHHASAMRGADCGDAFEVKIFLHLPRRSCSRTGAISAKWRRKRRSRAGSACRVTSLPMPAGFLRHFSKRAALIGSVNACADEASPICEAAHTARVSFRRQFRAPKCSPSSRTAGGSR